VLFKMPVATMFASSAADPIALANKVQGELFEAQFEA
jgi:hypothetical protein